MPGVGASAVKRKCNRGRKEKELVFFVSESMNFLVRFVRNTLLRAKVAGS